MEFILKAYTWLTANGENIAVGVGGLLVFLQLVTRLTPTESDDGFVTKIGKAFDKLCDLLKIPNNKK
jgi:hypothetical protein